MKKKSDEACRVVILCVAEGVCDVAAPMKHKDLCFNILRDAKAVIDRSPPVVFTSPPVVGARVVVAMNMKGVVDVGAPLPPLEMCHWMLAAARDVIERYDDEAAPPMRAFPAAITGE